MSEAQTATDPAAAPPAAPAAHASPNFFYHFSAILLFVVLCTAAVFSIAELVARNAIQSNLESELQKNSLELAELYRVAIRQDDTSPATAALKTTANSSDADPTAAKRLYLEQSVLNIRGQLKTIAQLNALGSYHNRCGILRSIASGIPGFENECYLRQGAAAAGMPGSSTAPSAEQQRRALLYSSLVAWDIVNYFEELSSELLFLLVAALSGGVGRLLFGLRDDRNTCLRDLAIGMGVGFIVYLALSSGVDAMLMDISATRSSNRAFVVALIALLAGAFANAVLASLQSQVETALQKRNKPA